jgi:uncharacterized protein YxjI
MVFYVKQKVFSFRDRFTVKDQMGNDVYYVEGELMSLGKKLHIYGMNGREEAFISQRLASFKKRFEVYIQSRLAVTIVKDITFLTHKYRLEGTNWVIMGDYLSHDYQSSAAIFLLHPLRKNGLPGAIAIGLKLYMTKTL